jgi:hypothetical protein
MSKRFKSRYIDVVLPDASGLAFGRHRRKSPDSVAAHFPMVVA